MKTHFISIRLFGKLHICSKYPDQSDKRCHFHQSRARTKLIGNFPALATRHAVFPRFQSNLFVIPVPAFSARNTGFLSLKRLLLLLGPVSRSDLGRSKHKSQKQRPKDKSNYIRKTLGQKTHYTYLRKARKRSRSFVSLFLSSFDKFPSKFSGISIVSQIRLDVFVNLEKKWTLKDWQR